MRAIPTMFVTIPRSKTTIRAIPLTDCAPTQRNRNISPTSRRKQFCRVERRTACKRKIHTQVPNIDGFAARCTTARRFCISFAIVRKIILPRFATSPNARNFCQRTFSNIVSGAPKFCWQTFLLARGVCRNAKLFTKGK